MDVKPTDAKPIDAKPIDDKSDDDQPSVASNDDMVYI